MACSGPRALFYSVRCSHVFKGRCTLKLGTSTCRFFPKAVQDTGKRLASPNDAADFSIKICFQVGPSFLLGGF